MILAVLIVIASLSDRVTELAEEGNEGLAYLLTGALVALDAVIPILPGETTLNLGGTLAADGVLDLGPVILAGALGAIVGDSALYWIGRSSSGSLQRFSHKLAGEEKMQRYRSIIAEDTWVLVIFGRWIPGMRQIINLSCGSIPIPYTRFLPISVVGCFVWAIYAAVLGYVMGEATGDADDWVSIVLSMLAGAIIVSGIAYTEKRREAKRQAATQEEAATDV